MNISEETLHVRLDELWPVMEEQLATGGTVRFGPKGISMLPMLRQGVDTVVLKKAPDRLKKYDIPLYRRKDGQFVLHRVVRASDGVYTMCGDNQYCYEKGVKQSQILAVVCGFWRGDTYVEITDKQYLRYCKRRVASQYLLGKKIMVKRIIKKVLNRFAV